MSHLAVASVLRMRWEWMAAGTVRLEGSEAAAWIGHLDMVLQTCLRTPRLPEDGLGPAADVHVDGEGAEDGAGGRRRVEEHPQAHLARAGCGHLQPACPCRCRAC